MWFRGIRANFIVTFLSLVFVPLVIAGVFGVYYSVNALEDRTLRHLRYEVSSKAEDIERFLKTVHLDAIFLGRSASLRDFVDSGGQKGSAEFERLKGRVSEEFRAFSQTRPYYYQMRYIDDAGREVIRIDSDGNSSVVVPASRLQYKGDRYYFIESMKYSSGQCYVSPMDLNEERGAVEIPHRMVVRIATPVFDTSSRRKGVVVINLYANYLIQQLKALSAAKDNVSFLVSRDGFYLSRLDSHGTENKPMSVSSSANLKGDYRPEVASSMLSGGRGIVKTSDSIISYAPIYNGDSRSSDYWVLSLAYPKKEIFASLFTMEVVFIVLGSFAAATALLVGLWMARRFTSPILELHKGVEWISEGDFGHKLDIRTGDEIETLAGRFNAMADTLKAYRDRMERWNEELQAEVDSRTRELKVEKNKVANIIMSAREGIIVADNEDRIIIVNPAAESILGVKSDDLLGKSVFDICGDARALRDSLHDRKAGDHDMLTCVVNSRIIEVGGAPINYEGEKFGLRLVLRDVTERRRLVEERMLMERQLFHADKLVALGELSAGIAHEVGNPLASIKAVIQAVNDETPFSGEQKKYMDRIMREVDRLSVFIRRFSEFAHARAARPAVCRVEQVLDDVVFLVRNEAMKHDIRIRCEVKGGTPAVVMNSDQLKQVMINLLINAIQAMREGGEISIVAAPLDGGGSVAISVMDNGPGISPENISKVFDPFFTTKPTGTGLGLSIVHKIIKEYDGQIIVRSSAGEGTTFEITLPSAGSDGAALVPGV